MDSGKTQEVNEEERIDDRRTMAITFRGSEVGLRRLSEWIEQAAPDCNVKIIYTKIRDVLFVIVPLFQKLAHFAGLSGKSQTTHQDGLLPGQMRPESVQGKLLVFIEPHFHPGIRPGIRPDT